MGVYTFKQIALWTDEQAHEFSSRLGFKERVEREHWREQARALHEQKYGVKL
jgi:predicted flap endonuclease-1-like 5' DNA nuclease